jgi:hypothetical protein
MALIKTILKEKTGVSLIMVVEVRRSAEVAEATVLVLGVAISASIRQNDKSQ